MRGKCRYLAVLLSVSMISLLAACGSGENATGQTAADEQTAANGQTAADGQTAAGGTKTNSAADQTTGAGGADSSEAAAGRDSLIDRSAGLSETSKGVKVKVDYSKYQASQTKKANYTRIGSETITDLKASDDYGEIYPFVGDVMYVSWEDGSSYVGGYRYGIADAKGEIVCDPVYDEVSVLYYTDPESGKSVSSGFYLLNKTTVPEGVSEEDYYSLIDCKYAVASMDGSFVTDCSYSGASAFPGGLILQEGTDSDQVTVLDEKGNTLFTEKDLKQIAAGSEIWIYWAGMEDRFVLFDMTGEQYYYIDQTGKTVLGPYQSADVFSRGLARVGTDRGTAIIDSQGNYILEADASEWLNAVDGYIYSENEETGTVKFYDGKGNLLVAVEDAQWGGVAGEYFTADKYDESGDGYYHTRVYDHEGNLILSFSGETGGLLPDLPVYYECAEDKLTLKNLDTGAEREITGANAHVSNILLVSGQAEDYDTDNSLIYAAYAEPGTEEEDYIYHYTYFDPDTLEVVYDAGANQSLELVIDRGSNERLLLKYAGNNIYRLLDDNFEVTATYHDYPYFYNGTVVVTDDKGCSIVNANGEEIFYYPLVQTYDD